MPDPAAFAADSDVATRLRRDLSDAEKNAANAVIQLVTGLIAETLNEDDDWAADLDPVPSYYKALCIKKAVAALANPEGVETLAETLGAYSYTTSYDAGQGVDIELTERERRRILRIARGGSLQSVTQVSPYSGDDVPTDPLLP